VGDAQVAMALTPITLLRLGVAQEPPSSSIPFSFSRPCFFLFFVPVPVPASRPELASPPSPSWTFHNTLGLTCSPPNRSEPLRITLSKFPNGVSTGRGANELLNSCCAFADDFDDFDDFVFASGGVESLVCFVAALAPEFPRTTRPTPTTVPRIVLKARAGTPPDPVLGFDPGAKSRTRRRNDETSKTVFPAPRIASTAEINKESVSRVWAHSVSGFGKCNSYLLQLRAPL
jgi:hypothetical protein